MKKREVVSSLATRYYSRLVHRAGGALPPVTSERAWQGLAESMRIAAGPLPRPCPKSFKARLFFHRGLTRWFIIYTPDAHARQRCEMICHELVEYMTHQDFGPVIDRAPRYSFAYDGGARPADVRHQISLAVTRMAFGSPGPTSARSLGTPIPASPPSMGQPVLDSLLKTGQLHLAVDLPGREQGDLAIDLTMREHDDFAVDLPAREQGRFGDLERQAERSSEAIRWPHQSGRCRCGCLGTLHGLLEETA